jgi:hypothetical protein
MTRTVLIRTSVVLLSIGLVLFAANTCRAKGPKSAAGDVFVAQVGSGLVDGSSCANARPVSFFNGAANWGSGKPIGPGAVVRLCGTISSGLTAQASGASGNPITVRWEPGARLSEPVCPLSGCFNTNSQSDLVLDGGSNGVVENTDNGTNLGHQSPTKQIVAVNCDRCEIKNLTVQNAYVHVGANAETDQTQMTALDISGSNWSVHDNTIHDAGWAITSTFVCSTGNVRLYGNNIYNFDHAWTPRTHTPCTHWGPFFFYANHVHDPANWDTASNAYHHDGIHCFVETGAGAAHLDGFYIYNNRFDGNWGNAHTTSPIFEQGNYPGDTQSCSDDTSPLYLFNNVFTTSQSYFTNGCASVSYGILLFANNTCDGTDPTNTSSVCLYVLPTETFVNNVVGGCNQLINGSSSPVALDYNAYGHCSGSFNCFAIGPSSSWTGSFTTYRSHFPSLDVHSVADGSLAAGANSAGVGQNLTPLCTGNLTPLCSDINGSPRATSGVWNAGASG